MAERVAELYADISIRGADDFDARLESGRQGLIQMGRSADQSAEQVRRAALKQSSAYQEVQKELEKAQRAARTSAQAQVDAADRERLAIDRAADTIARYGRESAQAVRAQDAVQRAHRETEAAARRAERATDQLTVTQRRAGQVAEEAAASMRQAGQDIDGAIPTDLASHGDEAGGSFGGGFMASAATKLKGLGGKGGPIATAVMGVATIGLAAGALLAKAISEGAERERIQDNIQGQLGIDDESAARIGKAASEAYMDAWGESVQGNMESLRSLADFKLLDTSSSQKDMEGLIAKVETLNTTLGTETPESLRAVSGLVRSGLVKNLDEAADLIVHARQRGMDAQGDLIDSISEYSVGWKNTGLSAQTALALIDQSMRMGVDNTDRGADALREFGRRVTEEGPKMITALDKIGLNGQAMYDSFKKGGPEAEKAFDATFDKIRAIKDPVERNQAAMALLGDTAGDFIGVFAKWDPSKAVSDFGSVAGAADEASRVMNDNAATTWEGVQRTVEEATMGIKQAMAEAFGPAVGDMAQGILANKDELVAFFADVVSAALTMGEGIGQVAVGVLHYFGFIADGFAKLWGPLVGQIGTFTDSLGDVISKIPGMKSVGEGISDAGQKMQGFQSTLEGVADGAHGMADTIADTVIPGIVAMRDGVDAAGDSARRSAEGMDTLTNSTLSIPDEKTVIISDNSPEAKERLTQLGFTVTTLPDGTVQVVANTADALSKIQELTQSREARVDVKFYGVDGVSGRTVDTSSVLANNPNAAREFHADGAIVEKYADGGLPADATIQQSRGKRGLVQWAESDAGPWEAFIPGGESKRPRATNILAEVADRFGYKLYKAADGGITDADVARMGGGTVNLSIWKAIKAANPKAVLTSAKTDHDVDGGLHPKGEAIDVDPSAQNLAWAWANRDQLAMIISAADGGSKNWYNMNGERAEGQAAVAIYGAGVVAQHGNHIHLGALHDVSGGAATSKSTKKDTRTPRQKNIDTVIAEGKKRKMSPKQIKAAVMALLAEAGGEDPGDAPGSEYDSEGGFQQRPSQGWGPASESLATDAGQFYDRLKKVDPKLSEAQMAQAVQRSAFKDGSNYAAQSAAADKEIAASEKRGAAMSSSSSSDTSTSSSGPVQDVRVTNWPSSLGGSDTTASSSSSKTTTAAKKADSNSLKITSPLMRGRAPIKLFADGGLEDHTAQIVRPGDYRVWGEPETGGEGYVPLAPSKRPRSLRIWAELGRRMGVKGFGEGGFGGYTADTRDAMKPTSLYDLLSIGSGVGFMAASGIIPLAQMAASGKIDLGNIAPTFDSSANDLPGLSEAVGGYADQISEQLAGILQAVRDGKNITVTVESDQGPASMLAQKRSV